MNFIDAVSLDDEGQKLVIHTIHFFLNYNIFFYIIMSQFFKPRDDNLFFKPTDDNLVFKPTDDTIKLAEVYYYNFNYNKDFPRPSLSEQLMYLKKNNVFNIDDVYKFMTLFFYGSQEDQVNVYIEYIEYIEEYASREYDMFEMQLYAIKDIKTWDTSDITNMRGLFLGRRQFDADITGWKVSNVTDMSNMFSDATAFKQNLRRWTINNKEVKFTGMFKGASAMIKEYSAVSQFGNEKNGYTPIRDFFTQTKKLQNSTTQNNKRTGRPKVISG